MAAERTQKHGKRVHGNIKTEQLYNFLLQMQFPTFFAKTATQIANKFLLQLVILKFC